MKLFSMAQGALNVVLVHIILINTMLMNIFKWINPWIRFLRIYKIKLRMLYNLSSQASSLIMYLNVLGWS